MDNFCLINRLTNHWQIYYNDGINEYVYNNENLQSLYQAIYPKVNKLKDKTSKVIWCFNLLESGYFVIERSKNVNLRDLVYQKYNYNIEKIKFINFQNKYKNKLINCIFSLNKEDYEEMKDFLLLFKVKIKDDMFFSYKYGMHNRFMDEIVLYKIDDIVISHLYNSGKLSNVFQFDYRFKEKFLNQFNDKVKRLFVYRGEEWVEILE